MKRNLFALLVMLVMIFTGFSSYAQDCGYYPVRKGAVMGYHSLDDKGKLVICQYVPTTHVQSDL